MDITIRPISSETEREACIAVRVAVFVREQGGALDREIDAYDAAALHFAVFHGDAIVGTARLIDCGDGVGRIGRFALLPEYRGNGIGKALMRRVLHTADAQFNTLVLSSQVTVKPFYEAFGFVAEGPVYIEGVLAHQKMVRRLTDGI